MNVTNSLSNNMRDALIALSIGAGAGLVLVAVLAGLSVVDLVLAAAVVVLYVAIVASTGLFCAGAAVALVRIAILLMPAALLAWTILVLIVSRFFAPVAPPPRGALSA